MSTARYRLLKSFALLTLFAMSAVAFSVATFGARGDPARAQEAYRMSIDQTIVSEDQDNVTAFVSISDAAGHPVVGLSDFHALVDSTTVPVRSVTSVVNQEAGIAVLLLIDISGSMQGEPLERARSAASALVQELLPKDTAALMPFAGTAPEQVEFTSDKAALQAEIDKLATEPGGTALNDAIVGGLRLSSQSSTIRRAIVLLTDGEESGASKATRDEALAAAAQSGIPIFTVGLGQQADTNLLQTLATSAGGLFLRAPSPNDLPEIFRTVGEQLRSQYQVVVPIPRATYSTRDLVLQVQLGQATSQAHAQFQSLPPASASTSAKNRPPNWVLAAAIAGMVPVLLLTVRRMRRPRRAPKSPIPGGPGILSERVAPGRHQTDGKTTIAARLIVVEGPSSGRQVEVSRAPVEIGTDPTCQLQLVETDRLGTSRKVRAWLRQDRLIVHQLIPGASISVGGSIIDEWATLEPQETMQIGPNVIVFSVVEPNP